MDKAEAFGRFMVIFCVTPVATWALIALYIKRAQRVRQPEENQHTSQFRNK